MGERKLFLFIGGEGPLNEQIEITARGVFLYVYTKTSLVRKGDQPMPAAVADIEADTRSKASDYCEGLFVVGDPKLEFIIVTTEPVAEKGTESRSAKGEAAPGSGIQESVVTQSLHLIEP